MGNTSSKVTWLDERSGNDANGSKIKFRKCDNWVNNDPNSCADSARENNVPVKKWIKCAIGSSPGGLEPGNTALACSPATDEMSCAWGAKLFRYNRLRCCMATTTRRERL